MLSYPTAIAKDDPEWGKKYGEEEFTERRACTHVLKLVSRSIVRERERDSEISDEKVVQIRC